MEWILQFFSDELLLIILLWTIVLYHREVPTYYCNYEQFLHKWFHFMKFSLFIIFKLLLENLVLYYKILYLYFSNTLHMSFRAWRIQKKQK